MKFENEVAALIIAHNETIGELKSLQEDRVSDLQKISSLTDSIKYVCRFQLTSRWKFSYNS